MKNRQKRVRGLVLKKRDLFGDREITILTETGFKIKLFVKGINKSVNREIIATDTFSYSEFIFYNNFIVNKLSLINRYNISNLENFKTAFYISSVVDYLSHNYINNRDLFTIFNKALQNINSQSSKELVSNFLNSFLKHEGIYTEKQNIRDIERHIYEYLDVHFDYNKFMNYI